MTFPFCFVRKQQLNFLDCVTILDILTFHSTHEGLIIPIKAYSNYDREVWPAGSEGRYLDHSLSVCGGQSLGLVQVDLRLVQPGADVGQVLVKDLHLILVALMRVKRENSDMGATSCNTVKVRSSAVLKHFLYKSIEKYTIHKYKRLK